MKLSPATVLIVDDTPANLTVLVEALSGSGLEILVAEDGESALEQVPLSRPDIILLDVMMPGIDGYATCRRLKEDEVTRPIPVLFMTALSETVNKLKAFSLGAVDFITKPFQQEEVLARVGAHLRIARLQRELEDQIALRDRLMGIARHDLRNPLLSIELACACYGESHDPEQVAMGLRIIRSSARRMSEVVTGFLDVNGDAAHSGQPVGSLDLIAEEVIQQNELIAMRKGIPVQRDLQLGGRLTTGTPSHLHQAVTNYLSNAIKFSPLGGVVTVRTGMSGEMARLEVRDQGPGIRIEERERLFQPLAQLSNQPTAGEPSTGLGLSIVRQLIEASGGRTGAEFPAEGGSVFWLEVALA